MSQNRLSIPRQHALRASRRGHCLLHMINPISRLAPRTERNRHLSFLLYAGHRFFITDVRWYSGAMVTEPSGETLCRQKSWFLQSIHVLITLLSRGLPAMGQQFVAAIAVKLENFRERIDINSGQTGIPIKRT